MLIGICGPPGGGKTFSALRLATGMQRVRPGPIVVIDTESGRVSKYHTSRGGPFEFMAVRFDAPYNPDHFLDAIEQQLGRNPAAIIVDSLSDEHEGPGGVIDWHDQEVPSSGGNDWAAWKRPKAARKRLVSGILRITVPLLFTFRAREKTTTKPGSKVPEKLGWQPVAPAEIVHAIDLMSLLPPRADGVPVWKSEKVGEEFVIKLPEYLRPYIREATALDEDMGEAFARWAMGKPVEAFDAAGYHETERRWITISVHADDVRARMNDPKNVQLRRRLPTELRDDLVAVARLRINDLSAPKETENHEHAEARA
jgi:hypothetical protein